ncbi:EAL domain-containing protein [Psychrobium sp. MM17-31]|uniref:sensor domain-containing protein n=1 Tax=Psychrobium sp. MM17-31 TaxID=2917758 RepID=UPI001EF5FF5F|nr:EAL domain-containing protein [Psychrobium sp. MM17-31]MCG7532736.1 EAL domain-containing protein [Psychrobium sp. MM17-31]
MFKTFLVAVLFLISIQSLASDTTFDEFFRPYSLPTLLISPDDGKIVDANDAAIVFYGYSRKEFQNISIQDVNLLSAEQVATERQAAKLENRNYFIFRHKMADGSIKTVQVYSSPIIVKNRKLLFSTIRDISSQRQLEQELWHYQDNLETMVDKQIEVIRAQNKKQFFYLFLGITLLIICVTVLLYLLSRKKSAENRIKTLSQIVEQSPIAIATIDDKGRISYGNSQFEEQYSERCQQSIINQPFIDLYADSGDNADELAFSMRGGISWQGELGSELDTIFERWEMLNVFPLSNAANKTEYVVISRDVSLLKENEKQLRLASTVFHTATEAVMICNNKQEILAINQAFTEITGFSEQETIGKTPTILRSGHHDQGFYNSMIRELKRNGSWQGEVSNRRKSGELYYEWLAITALCNPQGEIEAYVGLFSDITKRKKAEDKIYHQANYDALTGLANRNMFSDRLVHALDVASHNQSKLALLFIDLDGFKQVNDNLGHSQGDILLQQVSERITACVTSSNMVSRLGGDEFAIIFTEPAEVDTVEDITNDIIQEIARPYDLNGHKAYITASIGIAVCPDDGDNAEELLTKADSAMYKAKANGRNKFQFFTKEMDEEAQNRRTLMGELREAVHNEDFEVWFQPIHHCQSTQLEYTEALVRWRHPIKGIIAPIHFIPLAEEMGLINAIGHQVLKQACRTAADWQSTLAYAPGVAVNVSSLQFQQPNFVEQVTDVLRETGLAPNKLILEITESLLIADDEQVFSQLTELRRLGINISLDDFGTGYSSLSYLKRFPVNKLKIDRSFVKDIEPHNTDTRLINAIVSMAKSLQMEVVAEGVETDFQLRQLHYLGCDLVQGYVYSKPLSPPAISDYLQSLQTVNAAAQQKDS